MNKLEKIQAAINSLPEEFSDVREVCFILLGQGDLMHLLIYLNGLRAMALHLTSDEKILKPLNDIGRLLI